MNIPPLCILQMRHGSTRLPGKMLLPIAGETLAARGWRVASEAFGPDHCVVTAPAGDREGPLGEELERIQARVMYFDGDETDLLARFYVTAHTYRWHPASVIVRYTPDDPWKSVDALRRVACGERLPVEIGGEAFALAQLDAAFHGVADPSRREHLTFAFFDVPAPEPAALSHFQFGTSVLTIDTQADYDAVCRRVAEGVAS